MSLQSQERGVIYVFASNKSGRHESGSALHARLYKGAKQGNGFGRQGMAYAIPTKDYDIYTVLSIQEIGEHVKDFIRYAKDHPNLSFKVWQIGTGKAGYTDQQMAPLFVDAPPNCIFAASWRRIIAQEQLKRTASQGGSASEGAA